MNNFIDTQSLTPETIPQIWSLVSAVDVPTAVDHVAISFQGQAPGPEQLFYKPYPILD